MGNEPTILQLISSPVFWFSTVIIGVIVGVLGNLATDGVRKLQSIVSSSQREKEIQQQEKIQKAVQYLLDNPGQAADFKLDLISDALKNLVLLIVLLVIQNSSLWELLLMALQNILQGGDISVAIYFGIQFVISVFAVMLAQKLLNKDKNLRVILQEYEKANRNRSGIVKA